MATRVIENRRDRLVTILVAPLMSCSARLPVYVLLIGAFVPDVRFAFGLVGAKGLTMFAMYSVGALAAIGVALILKRPLLKGPTPPFVMELPSYKMPGVGIVLSRRLGQGRSAARRLLHFPRGKWSLPRWESFTTWAKGRTKARPS